MNNEKLLTATKHYCTTILFAELDESDMPLDKKYGICDFSQEFMQVCAGDIKLFFELAGDLIQPTEVAEAAQALWLTRNGHGCGFWDGDWDDRGDTLTNLVHNNFKNIEAYVGDDGKIYG